MGVVINGVKITAEDVTVGDDLIVGDDAEIGDDLTVTGDSTFNGVATFAYGNVVNDNIAHSFGTDTDAQFRWSLPQTVDALLLGLSSTGHTFIITTKANITKNHDYSSQDNPTIFINSATNPDTNNTQYRGLSHNTTDSYDQIGKGSEVVFHSAPVSVADEASFTLPDASTGYGFFLVGDAEEYAQITWASDGTVTLVSNSANVVTTDTDAKFCFIDGGTQVSVKNRLGAAKEVVFNYHYTT
jgi:hypothetical protein